MGYGDKEGCCARLLPQVLDGIASSRLSGTLKKALAVRAVELALRGGPRPCAGHMEDEVAVREHVKVSLLLLIDIQEEITEAVPITPLKPVENRTAEQSVDVPVPLSCGNIDEVIQLIPRERMSVCTSSQIVELPSLQCHEDIVEMTAVRSVGVAMTPTGAVKKLFKGKGFGFIFPDDGSDDVFIHCKQLFETGAPLGRHRVARRVRTCPSVANSWSTPRGCNRVTRCHMTRNTSESIQLERNTTGPGRFRVALVVAHMRSSSARGWDSLFATDSCF